MTEIERYAAQRTRFVRLTRELTRIAAHHEAVAQDEEEATFTDELAGTNLLLERAIRLLTSSDDDEPIDQIIDNF